MSKKICGSFSRGFAVRSRVIFAAGDAKIAHSRTEEYFSGVGGAGKMIEN
jgi:hypothetical protein